MLILTLVACTDLPPGWEDAVPVESLDQEPCRGDPMYADAPVVTAEFAADPLTVEATDLVFRCDQDVEGFWKEGGGSVELLVQPTVLHPHQVAKCDCLYDLSIVVGSPEEPPGEVIVWRRSDFYGGDEPVPVEIGRYPAD